MLERRKPHSPPWLCSQRSRILRISHFNVRPFRRDESSLAVPASLNAGFVEPLFIPELTRYLLMLLIERFAVIGKLTGANLGASAGGDLQRPIWIGERLTGGADDVANAVPQPSLRHLELMNPACANDRGIKTNLTYGVPDRFGRSRVAAKRAPRIRDILRHTFIAAGTGIGVGGGADRGASGVVEFATARGREEIHPRFREGDADQRCIVECVAVFDAFLGKEATTDEEILSDGRTYGVKDFERQPQTPFERAAIAIAARIRAG